MTGSTQSVGSFEAWTAVISAAVLIAPLPLLARWFVILPLGGATAASIGLPVRASRLILAVFAALLTAMTASDRKIEIDIECAVEKALFTLKSVIVEHLFMFADGKPLALSWNDGGRPAAIADFREATVITARNITPHMRRVTVSITDIDRYVTGSFHLRRLIPPKGRAPVWPHAGNDGRIVWPKDEDALTVRIYTVHPARGRMDIDIVLHEADQTPSATWALPAIAWIAAGLDADADARIFIEVEWEGEEQDLVSSARIKPVWLYRNGRKAGIAGYLEATVRAETLYAPDDRFYRGGGRTCRGGRHPAPAA